MLYKKKKKDIIRYYSLQNSAALKQKQKTKMQHNSN